MSARRRNRPGRWGNMSDRRREQVARQRVEKAENAQGTTKKLFRKVIWGPMRQWMGR